MGLAIEAVRSKAMSKRKATMTIDMPRTTLSDNLSGRIPEARTRPGPATIL
ncbi:hypothetical protein DPMN_000042 [Dreissena polymorpha]|uniref:HTH psq-type domain-containing protein n=1 Tax=Dreissena polymorpha TaxID=45954 RepID=A0A9D4MHE5_DREPO|nr:hypothetical protein DPMN_000012 [Dreissena polymorpha]KAH3876205.1 hypothetical protein DPMN_000042 [Dreissena polymorpha]